MMSYVIPILLAIFGFYVWSVQLVAKRKFEVAERALRVFDRTNDALSAIRSPMSFTNEHDRVKVAEGLTREQAEAQRHYGIYQIRAAQQAEEFSQVRLVELLCRLHISEEAADAMAVLAIAPQGAKVDNQTFAVVPTVQRDGPPFLNEQLIKSKLNIPKRTQLKMKRTGLWGEKTSTEYEANSILGIAIISMGKLAYDKIQSASTKAGIFLKRVRPSIVEAQTMGKAMKQES